MLKRIITYRVASWPADVQLIPPEPASGVDIEEKNLKRASGLLQAILDHYFNNDIQFDFFLKWGSSYPVSREPYNNVLNETTFKYFACISKALAGRGESSCECESWEYRKKTIQASFSHPDNKKLALLRAPPFPINHKLSWSHDTHSSSYGHGWDTFREILPFNKQHLDATSTIRWNGASACALYDYLFGALTTTVPPTRC